jgi:CHAT domain-containing protein
MKIYLTPKIFLAGLICLIIHFCHAQSGTFSLKLNDITKNIYCGRIDLAGKQIADVRKNLATNYLDEALLLDAEGELLYRQMDVDAAEVKWKMANSLLQKTPVDSIYFALSISRFARIANYRIELEKAMRLSSEAVALLQRHQESVKLINAGVIYREYAYAHKMFLLKEYTEADFDSVVNDIKTTIHYSELSLGKNNYYIGSALHDWGNLWIDRSNNYSSSSKRDSLFRWCNKNAHILYRKSIAANQRFFNGGERIALSYMLMGLMNNIHFLKDSMEVSFGYYNKAMQVLIPDFKPTSIYNNPSPRSNLNDIARILQNIHYKATTLLQIYHKTYDIGFLYKAYQQSKDEEGWYELLLRTYQSKDISLVMGEYGILPYPNLAVISAELYRLTKQPKYLSDLYTYTELQHHFSLLTSTVNKKNLTKDLLRTIVAGPSLIQNKLNSRSAILEFINPQNAILITKKALIPFPIKWNLSEELPNVLIKNDFVKYKAMAYQSYRSIFSPVESSLKGIKNIIIIPHTGSVIIPYEAFLTDTSGCATFEQSVNRALIKKFNICYHYSATLWYADTITGTTSDLAVFNPTYANLGKLPFNQNLSAKLSNKYQGNFFTGQRANRINFIQTFNNSNSTFHIAAHGDASMDYNDLTNLYFAGEKDSGALSPEAIIPMQSHSPLVVLAACKTNMGRGFGGEGLMNFSRAFKVAGAKATISSIWSVDDQATSELLEMFYAHLEEGKSKSEALRLAKLDFIEQAENETANPLYWSGLVLYGNDTPLLIERRAATHLWMGFAAAFMLIGSGALLYRRKNQFTK